MALGVHTLHVRHVVAALRRHFTALRLLDLLARELSARAVVGLKLLQRLAWARENHDARTGRYGRAGGGNDTGRDQESSSPDFHRRLPDEAEPLALDAEGDVELAAEVLERDRRRQLHHLRLGEMPAELGEQLVGDLLPGDRHGLRVAQRRALSHGVKAARRERGDLTELVLRGAFPQTAGRIDVDSERTAVDQRDAQIDERQQRLWQ